MAYGTIYSYGDFGMWMRKFNMVIDIQIDCKNFVKNRLLEFPWFAKTEEVTGTSNLNYLYVLL